MEQSYKEKYEQALAKAKEQYNYPCMRSCMGILEEIFPELAESEDERVSKRISQSLHGYLLNSDEIIQADAWLKKQAEHANFLSKIQVGDKVTRNEAGVLVNISQLNRVAKPEENNGNLGGISANSAWSKENDMGLWLARDKSGELWVYDNKPQRYDNYYRNKDEDIHCLAVPIYEVLYPEVTFENSPVELVPKMVDKSQTKYCGSYTTTTSVDNKNRRV